MPNWCLNEVKASKNVLKEIYDKKNKCVTFQKLIPMPKSLMVSASSMESVAIEYALLKMNKVQREETLEKLKRKNYDYYNKIAQYTNNYQDSQEKIKALYKYSKEYKPDEEEQSLGINSLLALGNTYISNIINYNFSNWYDWRNCYWGTKWDASNSYGSPKEGFLSFDTPWNPPEGIVNKLFEKFPKEDINWYYEEPGMDFAGNYTPDFNGGAIDNPCPVPNYYDEEDEEMEDN